MLWFHTMVLFVLALLGCVHGSPIAVTTKGEPMSWGTNVLNTLGSGIYDPYGIL
jgi:hypothetical protein